MTRDEFVDGYLARSRAAGSLRDAERTPDGYRSGEFRRVALPCACGDDGCEGWAMVSSDPEMVADHMQLHAPKDPHP